MCGQQCKGRRQRQHRPEHRIKDRKLVTGWKLKFLTPLGMDPGLDGRDSTDYATATDIVVVKNNARLKCQLLKKVVTSLEPEKFQNIMLSEAGWERL